MRPGQKNRMRGGRGNGGGRRGPNPLTRSYESNGPDVKVRGTPQHIAEKYVQLARDAHSSGDTVMAESYLQHAEHYYRIIAAAQHAQQVAYNQANGLPAPGADEAMDDEDEFEVAGADRFTFRTPQSFSQQGGFNGQNNGYGQQPFQNGQQQPYGDAPGMGDQPPMGADGQPMEGGGQPQNFQQQGYQQRGPRPDRQFEGRRFDGQGGGREGGNRDGGGRDRHNRRFGRDRNFGERSFGDRAPGDGRQAEGQGGNEGGSERPVENAFVETQPVGLPSFITGGGISRNAGADEGPEAAPDQDNGEAAGRFRNRRRRRPRADEGSSDTGGGSEGGSDQG
jgi:hypothetical protein